MGSVAVGVGVGSGWRISRSDRVTCVALEICRIDVLLLVLGLLWCWRLRVALARSCIVTGDPCIIGVLSVAIVTVVMDSACGTNTVLSCMWESLFNCMLSLHSCLNIWFLSGFACEDWILLCGCYGVAVMS